MYISIALWDFAPQTHNLSLLVRRPSPHNPSHFTPHPKTPNPSPGVELWAMLHYKELYCMYCRLYSQTLRMHCANSQCAETNIFQNNATKTKTCVNWFLWLNQEPKCVCLIKKHQHWKFSWSCLFNYFIDNELRKPSMLTYLVYIFNCFGTASEKPFWLSLLNSKEKCRGGH